MKKMEFQEIVGFSHACDSTGLSRIALRAWPDEVHEHVHMGRDDELFVTRPRQPRL